MARLLAYLLTALVLAQTFGQELLVVDYAVNRVRITQLYCVNKARPQLHCNGKCYLAQRLRRAAERESKAPGTGLAKVKFEVVLPGRLALPPARPAGRRPAPRYAALPVPRLLAGPLAAVFQPPAQQS